MNNTVYTYDRITSKDSLSVTDYTSFYYGGLDDLFNQYPEYFEYISLNDSIKMEGISWRRYNNENFADVLLACNQEVFLWSMPYGNDTLIEIKEALQRIFQNELGISTGDARFEEFTAFLNFIDDDVEDRNTQKRLLRVPIENKMSDVVNLISNYRTDNKVDNIEE